MTSRSCSTAIAAPFVFLRDEAEAIRFRHHEGELQLRARRAAPERVGELARPHFLMREVARVEQIPVTRAVREVVDERAGLDRRGDLRGLQLRGRDAVQ